VRGDTLPVDPEIGEAFDRLGADLRGEISSVDANLRGVISQVAVDLRGEIQTSAAGILQQLGEFESRMRRHFDVVVESVRAESRFVAEGTALLSQRMDRRDSEDAERHDGLEGRVVKLEVRVKGLEDNQKPRRRPR
jgi:hypothetical protein